MLMDPYDAKSGHISLNCDKRKIFQKKIKILAPKGELRKFWDLKNFLKFKWKFVQIKVT